MPGDWQKVPGSAKGEVDVGSLENNGLLLRYRSREFAFNRYIVEDVVANCVERTRGSWTDMRMYTVYTGTKTGYEVDFACSEAEKQGILTRELATAAPSSQKPSEPELSGPSNSVEVPPQRRGRGRVLATGSGFYVNPSAVVTNLHVIRECGQLQVVRGTDEAPATVEAIDKRNDLALLRVSPRGGLVPSLRASAALGEEVMVAGHPMSGLLARDLIVTGGQVNSMAGLGNDPTFIQISAPVQAGNSGGPVLDRMGNVVGVVVSKVNVLKVASMTGEMLQNINFAIKPELLRLFLDANRVQYQAAGGASKRLESTDLAERARAFTVQVVCQQ